MALKILLAFLVACAPGFAQFGLRSPGFAGARPVDATASWTPASAAGLKLWFKAETLTGSEGSSIAGWANNAPGYGDWYLTNATAAQRPYLTNTFNGLTGTNALFFNGLTNWFTLSNATALSVTRVVASCSIVAVARVGQNGQTKPFLFIMNNSAGLSVRESLALYASEVVDSGQRTLDADTAALGRLAHASSTNVALCYQVDHVHTNIVAVTGSAITIYTNNVAGTNVIGATPGYTSDTASYAIRVGLESGPAYFLGEIAELCLYVPAISSAERGSNYTHFKNKYQLP